MQNYPPGFGYEQSNDVSKYNKRFVVNTISNTFTRTMFAEKQLRISKKQHFLLIHKLSTNEEIPIVIGTLQNSNWVLTLREWIEENAPSMNGNS